MSLVDVDSWITEYEGCERLSHTIQNQIYQRDQEYNLSAEYSAISANIRIKLKQFETEVAQLTLKLQASINNQTLTVEESERRQRQIETLQSQLLQLQNKFRSVPGISTDRNILIPSTASELWEDDDHDNDDDEPILNKIANLNPNDLCQEQIQILEDQNKGLEALSATISRQKKLASRLGEEVEEQNEILDDLADNMERIDARVNTETRHIDLVNRQDGTKGYWAVIVLLFIAIIIVALI